MVRAGGMPVIGRGSVRAGGDVLHAAPLVLVVLLLGVAGLLATVAPSRVTSGVYQVVIGADADPLVVPTESLTCQRAAGTATCTTSVAGQPLTVRIPVTDGAPDPADSDVCTARHAGRSLACMAGIADYGHASKSVYIPAGIEVSEAERTRLRMAVPWWRAGTWWPVIGLALVLGLAVAAAAVGYLLGGRARSPDNPVTSATITGAAAWLMFAISGLIFAPSQALSSLIVQALLSLIITAPPVGVAVVSLAAWQWQLTSAGTCPRWRYLATAGAATAVYTAVAIFVFLLQGAFID